MSQNPIRQNPYQAPVGPGKPSGRPSGPMGPKKILTSFEGRIPRSTFWLWSFILSFAGIAIMMGILFASIAVLGEDSPHNRTSSRDRLHPVALTLLLVLYVPFIYCALAIQAKRWHDRDKSGWWSLIGLIPYIGGIWMFVECGCLAGNSGPNQYGPNPLD